MEFAQRHAISDVCILCADVERSIRFYVDKLGFRLKHRAEGFADFTGAGLTLALWEIDHISRHTGISNIRGPGAHKACIAVKLPSADERRRLLFGARRQGRAVPGAARGLSVERLLLLFLRPGRRGLGALRLARGRRARESSPDQGRAMKTLFRKAQILAMGGPHGEEPFEGDLLIEDDRSSAIGADLGEIRDATVLDRPGQAHHAGPRQRASPLERAVLQGSL